MTHTAQETSSRFVVTQSFSDGLAFVDLSRPADAVLVDRVAVGTAPWAVAVSEDTDRAFVATAAGVAVVSLAGRRLVSIVPYRDAPEQPVTGEEFGEYRFGGTGIVVSPDGSTVYVGVQRDGRDSTLEVLDVTSETIVASVGVGARPFDVQIAPDGSEIYTIDHDSFTVHIVNASDLSAVRAEVAPFGTELGLMSHQKPHYAAIDTNGDLLMPYQGRGLVRFSPSTLEYTTQPMTGDTHQHGTGLSPDGRLLVVGVGAIGGATKGASLTIRQLSTGEEILVPLDHGHENVVPWLDPSDGRLKAVLTGGSTSRNPWDGLTVVDLESLDITEIALAGRPQHAVQLSS